MTTAKSRRIIVIIGSLFVLFSIGISVCFADQYNSKDQEKGRDGHFIAYKCGVVFDTKTELEWVAGPDKNTNWNEAKQWVENLTIAGGGWRMPTTDELMTLYQEGKGSRNMTPLLKTTRWDLWSGETKNKVVGSSLPYSFIFNFGNGGIEWLLHNNSVDALGFAVRSRK